MPSGEHSSSSHDKPVRGSRWANGMLALAAIVVAVIAVNVSLSGQTAPQEQEASALCKKFSDSELAVELCTNFVARRDDFYRRFNRAVPTDRREMALRRDELVRSETSASVGVLSGLRAFPRWVCRVDRSGSLLCAKSSSLLALYNSQISEAFAMAVNTLVADRMLSSDAVIAAKCADGTWVSLDSDESGEESEMATALQLLCDPRVVAAIPHAVEEKLAAQGFGSGGSSFGMGSVTGFDPMDGMCLGLPTGSVGEALFNALLNLHAACFPGAGAQTPDPVSMISEGAASDGANLGPSEGATKVNETTTNEDGKTTTTTTWSDGTVTQVTTDNNTGDTTVAVTNVPNPDTGGTSSGGYVVDSDGNVTSSSRTEHDGDGNPISTTHYDGEGNVTSVEDENGRTDHHPDDQWFREGADGSWTFRFCLGGACYTRTYSKDVVDQLRGAQSCNEVDGTCMSQECREATNSYFHAQDACQLSSDGPACQQYTNASSCCDETSVGDPLVAMPNPEGGYSCSSGDVDFAQEACEEQCSVAGATDETSCIDNCMNAANLQRGQYDILEAACRYMYSDECFSMDVDFGFVGGVPLSGPGRGPLPSPMGVNVPFDVFMLFGQPHRW